MHGQSEVVFTDGSTGVAADAEFAFEYFLEDDLVVTTDSGSEINLDDISGIDVVPPVVESGSSLDDLPDAG